MKKYILILLSLLIATAILAGCACQHQWTNATCEAPKTCSQCEATEGEPLGHSWQAADCETPKTCSRCNLTEGNPLGHTWEEATCTSAKSCLVCGLMEGEPLEHNWEGEATLYAGAVCSVCAAEGDPLPGYLAQNNLSPNVTPAQITDYLTNTYVRPDLDTTGEFFASAVLICEYDETHRAKQGYEWRTADFLITFSDGNSGLFGTNVLCARADYYQEQVLKQAKKQETFKVTYHGKEYKCTALYENTGFYYDNDSQVFQMTCYVQVPIGYDGVVLSFFHGGIDVDGKTLKEAADENTLLFRMA